MRSTLLATTTILTTIVLSGNAFAWDTGGGSTPVHSTTPPPSGSSQTQSTRVTNTAISASSSRAVSSSASASSSRSSTGPVTVNVAVSPPTTTTTPATTTPAVSPSAATSPRQASTAASSPPPHAVHYAEVPNVSYNYSEPRQAPAIAAPALAGGGDCVLSASGGISTGNPLALLFGMSWENHHCENRQTAAILGNMGLSVQATALLCRDNVDVRWAMIDAGTPCPQDRQAWCVANPGLAGNYPEYCGLPVQVVRQQEVVIRRRQ